MTNTPLLSFYGDDFTGSTDAMESMARSGIRTHLFTAAPTPQTLARYPDLQAFGVAGMTRSMRPDDMERTLRSAFTSLRDSGTRIVHYKVCSTFDSSPKIGSIGRAIDVGVDIFSPPCVPLVVGMPSLGRYCAFGNLFARFGGDGAIYRLDRHPSMSRHPTTPMDEADLRRHLGKQTRRRVELIDVPTLDGGKADQSLDSLLHRTEEPPVVLIDAVHDRHLAAAGALIDRVATQRSPLFVVGSSAIEAAMAMNWSLPARAFPAVSAAGPIVAICGSCSPVTIDQIRWAAGNGFTELALGDEPTIDAAANTIRAGRSVIVHSNAADRRVDESAAKEIGPALGRVLRGILAATNVRRVIVAGGDTSGQVATSLSIESMEMIGELTRGSPLCRVTAPGSPADGIEITFKGGQIGNVDFFGFVERGATNIGET
jgi:3-oxoisoapionate kinase